MEIRPHENWIAPRLSGDSEAMLDILISSSPIGFAYLDRDLRYVKINPVLAKLNGFSVEDHIGRSIFDMLPSAAAKHAKVTLNRVLESGKPISDLEMELPIPGDDNRMHWFLGNFFPAHDPHGEIIGIGVAIADITRQKTTEIELKRSELEFRTIFESPTAGKVVIDSRTGLFERVNHKFCEMLGYSEEEVRGKTFIELTHPEEREWQRRAFEEGLQQGSWTIEKRYLRKDGGTVWVLVSAAVMDRENGVASNIMSTVIDITARKMAEEALRISQERLVEQARLLELTKDGIFIRDDKGVIFYWNKGAVETYGYTKKEALGKRVDDILRTGHTEPYDTADHAVMKTGAWSGELQQMTKSGQVITVISRWVLDKRSDGKVRILVTNSDITERKKAELELLKQSDSLTSEKQKLEAIFENSPAAMALWTGKDMVFEMVNPVYQAIFPDRQLVGRPFLEACPEFKGQAFPDILRHVFETGEKYIAHEMLARIRRPNGEFEDVYYDFTYARIDDANGNPYGVYDHAVDVTERVKARREREKAIENLKHEKDLRDHFTNALTHDLRNPLGTIKISAQLALRCRDDLVRREKMLHKAIDSVDRVDQMIDDLLDANLVKSGERLPLKLEDYDLRKIAEQAVDELAVNYGNRLQLKADGSFGGKWSVQGLRRVIDNLVVNAVKYGSQDTPITVSLEKDGRNVQLRVHNFGGELSPEEQKDLFGLFKRSKSARESGKKGWGIGLTLVKGIAEAHGGTVSVASAPGAGTTFIVSLPI